MTGFAAGGRVWLRLASDADKSFLRALDASVRAPMFTHLPEPMCTMLLEQQWSVSRRDRAERHGAAREELILLEGETVGAILTERRPAILDLIEIALLPPARGLGIGTTVLQCLIARAQGESLTVALNVYRTNPRALTLYQRLGFVPVDEDEILIRLERPPASGTSSGNARSEEPAPDWAGSRAAAPRSR